MPSCLKTLVYPKRTLSQLVELLFPFFCWRPRRKSCWRGRRGKSCGRSRGTNWSAQVWTEADVEDKVEDVNVVGSVDEVGVYGYESDGFTPSEYLRRKRLAKKNVSEGAVDTVHLPHFEPSNLQHLPVSFLLKFLGGQSLNSIRLVVLRALKHEGDFVRLLCFRVWSLRGTSGSFKWAWIASERRVWFRIWGWRVDVRKWSWEEEESVKARSLVALYSKLQDFSQLSGFFPVCLQAMPKRFREFQEKKMCWRAWRMMDSWRASHCCYQEPGIVNWRPQQDFFEAVHSRGRCRELLEQAFDDGNICVQMRNLLVLFHVDSKFSPLLCLSGQFVTDSAATVIRTTGHRMVFFCSSVCEERKAQLLSPLMNN